MENTTTAITIGSQTIQMRGDRKVTEALVKQWNAGDASARFALGALARKQGITLDATAKAV